MLGAFAVLITTQNYVDELKKEITEKASIEYVAMIKQSHKMLEERVDKVEKLQADNYKELSKDIVELKLILQSFITEIRTQNKGRL